MDRATYERLVRGIQWRELPGAYGPDDPIADHLIGAASPDERAAYQALGKVLAHVCHQNRLAAPAPQAAACLLRIADLSDVEAPAHPWVGLFGVNYLLANAWSTPRDFGVPPRPAPFAGERPPEQPEAQTARAAYDARSNQLLEEVRSAAPRLRSLLGHADPRVRAQSARLLAFVQPDQELRAALTEALDREQVDAVRGGLSVALACTRPPTGAPDPELLERLNRSLASQGDLEAIAAATALLLLDPAPCLSHHSQVIQAGLRFQTDELPYVFLRTFPWSQGRVPDLMAEALSRAQVPDPAALEPMVDAATYWSSLPGEPEFEVEWSEQDLIAMRILQRAFGEHWGRRDYLTSADLSPQQHSLAVKLAPLKIEGEIFSGYGFLDLGRDAARLLGSTVGGLDQELEGAWEGRAVKWPIWKWWHQCACMDRWDGRTGVSTARDRLREELRRKLPAAALLAAAQDAASGAYGVPPEWLRAASRS